MSGIFITCATSRIVAIIDIKDKDFVKYNSNYLISSFNNVKVDDYLEYEKDENINYILPGKSNISLNVKYDEYYQTSTITEQIKGSISGLEMIKQENLIFGRMPENEYEIVIDKLAIENLINNEYGSAKMAGIKKAEDLLNKKFSIPNIESFILVGIVDLESPSIYINKSLFINVICNSSYVNNKDIDYGFVIQDMETKEEFKKQILDYKLFENKIELKKGRLPENDYEVIVNISHEYEMKLNKTIDERINFKELTVVGYYDDKENSDYYLVNNNTIKYKLIRESNGLTIYAKDKNKALDKYKKLGIYIKDSYLSSKEEYLEEQKSTIKTNLTSAGIIVIISLIEILLMIRASFLSRIKEIGILRAIGVKKKDIYKLFAGEIIAITTLVSVPTVILTAYILNILKQISILSSIFVINIWIILFVIIVLYLFNLLVGLIPVYRVIRKRPAQILSRHDI